MIRSFLKCRYKLEKNVVLMLKDVQNSVVLESIHIISFVDVLWYLYISISINTSQLIHVPFFAFKIICINLLNKNAFRL